MVPSTRQFFLDRFASLDQRRLPSKRAAILGTGALDLRDGAKAIADKAADNPHFNDDGKRAARHAALFDHFVELERGRTELGQIKRDAEAAIGNLAIPTLENHDSLAEMRDQEARAIVRNMPQDKRDRLESLPPALAAAVVRAPAELSGVSASVHKMMREQIAEATHPEKLAALRGDLDGVKWATHVVNEAHEVLRNAAQFAPHEAGPFMANVKAKAAQPKEQKKTFDPDNNVNDWLRARGRPPLP